MHYTGLVEQTERFSKAAEAESTDWRDQYMRLSIRFETGAAQYAWLNTSVFVARGRPQGTGHWALGTSNIRCSGDVVCRTPHPLSSVRKSVGRRFAKRDARCAAGPADRDRA